MNMMKNCLLKHLFHGVSMLFLVFLLVGCASDDGDADQPQGPQNDPPTKPVFTLPANNATEVSPCPTYAWKASTDPNADKINYTVSFSTDQTTWQTSSAVSETSYQSTLVLKPETKYYWYVTATDVRGAATRSEIGTFTTSDAEVYADGSWRYYDQASRDGTIPLVFVGDGFILADHVQGADYDRKIDQGIEFFFNIEPYKSLRSKFKIIKLAAYSKERGITIRDNGDGGYTPRHVEVNTRFKVYYTGNGYNSTQMRMGANDNNLDAALTYTYDFVKASIPDYFTDEKMFDRTTIVVVANYWLYGGTCWWTPTGASSGKTISIVPACEEGRTIPWAKNWGVPFSYEATMHHEAGGHGFGRLGDEYVYGDSPTPRQIEDFKYYTQLGFNGNLDITNVPTQVKWKQFIESPVHDLYPQVGVYPGQFRRLVYMSEKADLDSRTEGSCMKVMYNPHSAVSREVIMRKIYEGAGENYTFQTFLDTDVKPINTSPYRKCTFSNIYRDMVHHSQPQTIVLSR